MIFEGGRDVWGAGCSPWQVAGPDVALTRPNAWAIGPRIGGAA